MIEPVFKRSLLTPEPAQFLPTRYWGRWGPERGRDLPQAQQWAQGRAILRQSFFPWHVPSLSPSSPFGVPPRTDSEAALNRPSLGYQHLRFHAGNSEGDRAAVTDLLWLPLFWKRAGALFWLVVSTLVEVEGFGMAFQAFHSLHSVCPASPPSAPLHTLATVMCTLYSFVHDASFLP